MKRHHPDNDDEENEETSLRYVLFTLCTDG